MIPPMTRQLELSTTSTDLELLLLMIPFWIWIRKSLFIFSRSTTRSLRMSTSEELPPSPPSPEGCFSLVNNWIWSSKSLLIVTSCSIFCWRRDNSVRPPFFTRLSVLTIVFSLTMRFVSSEEFSLPLLLSSRGLSLSSFSSVSFIILVVDAEVSNGQIINTKIIIKEVITFYAA